MKVSLEVDGQKMPDFLELIKGLAYIQVEEDDEPTKEEILEGLREAIEEVNQIKAGKKKGMLLKDFLEEL